MKITMEDVLTGDHEDWFTQMTTPHQPICGFDCDEICADCSDAFLWI